MKKSKGLWAGAWVCLLVVALVMTGCSSGSNPRELLNSATTNMMNLQSYTLKGHADITDLSYYQGAAGDEMAAFYAMLQDAKIDVHHIYQKKPMQTETAIDIHLAGEAAETITLQLITTKDKVYFKLPQFKYLPLPEAVAGKFLVMDLQELAEQGGTAYKSEHFNPEKIQQLAFEILGVIFSEYDSESYFKALDLEANEVQLPDGYNVKQLVEFQITDTQLLDALKILVYQAMPKVLDVMSKEEYLPLLRMTAIEMEKAKQEYAELDKTELDRDLEQIKKSVKINKLQLRTAIDEGNYPSYQDMDLHVEIKDAVTKEKLTLGLKYEGQLLYLNEKQQFKLGVPKDALTVDKLLEELKAAGL